MELLKLFKKIVLTGMSRGLTASGTFAINLLLAWQLADIDAYGKLAVCLTAITVLGIFSRFGADVALLRYGGAAWHVGDVVAYRRYVARTLAIVASLSVALGMLAAMLLIAVGDAWDASKTMLSLLPALPFLASSFVIGSAFKAAQRPETGALFEVGGSSLLACGLYLLWELSGYQLTPLSAANLFTLASVTFLLAGIATLRLTVWRRGATSGFQPVEPVSTLRYLMTSRDFAVIAGTQVVGNWCGLFLLELWFESSQAGAFSAAMRVAMLPLLLQNILVTVAAPRLAGLHEERDSRALKQLVGRAALVLFVANFPILLILAVAAPYALALFGPEYRDAWPLLSILTIGQLAGAVTGISAPLLGMVGQQHQVRRLGLISSISSLALSVPLTYQWGAVGAAIASAIYATLQSLLVAAAASRQFGFSTLPSIPRNILRSDATIVSDEAL